MTMPRKSAKYVVLCIAVCPAFAKTSADRLRCRFVRADAYTQIRRYSPVHTGSYIQDRTYRLICTGSYVQARRYRLVRTDSSIHTRTYRLVRTDPHYECERHSACLCEWEPGNEKQKARAFVLELIAHITSQSLHKALASYVRRRQPHDGDE